VKFIHLTDPHLTASGELFDLPVAARLEAAIDDIVRHHADAELCLVTGDITHWAETEAFATARRLLDRLPMPWHVLIGNHDARDLFAETFPETPRMPEGFFQYALDTSAGRFLCLDTVEEGQPGGVLCEARLRWLRRELAETPAAMPVYLFLHHAPMVTGIAGMDRIRLANAKDLANVLKGFRNVRHLFFGHLHRACHGSWHGIPFSTLKATAHQIAADLGPEAPLRASRELPAYAAVLLSADQVVVHDISYQEREREFAYDRNAGRPAAE
jgi:3',5'-cyclic-AMP phosphodiesterase